MAEPQKSPADLLKDEGNALFAIAHYKESIVKYTEAIELNPNNEIYWCNRAFANLKCENFGATISDASESIKLNPRHVKAYFHRATANFILTRLDLALQDFLAVVKMLPNNKEARDKYNACLSAKRTADFEAAIATPDAALASDMSLEPYVVPSDYDGPKYSNPPTVSFVESLLEHFRLQKKMEKRYCFELVIDSIRYFKKQPPLIDITVSGDASITVCGDTHGQYYDVLNLLKINGSPSEKNMYLFNGDFVDRGSFSCEVMLAFLAYKQLYPDHFFLVRGNHESLNMNKTYGFEGEVRSKYGDKAYPLFQELFCTLPLAHLINKKVFVVHGGLFSEDGVTLDQIRKINRFREPPNEGLMSDMLWSDPQPMNGRGPSKRGVGMSFGPDVTKRFCEENGLQMVIRSHEAKAAGYEIEADGKLVTVFSAPNYCDHAGNLGGYIRFTQEMIPEYFSFDCVPHPEVPALRYASPFAM